MSGPYLRPISWGMVERRSLCGAVGRACRHCTRQREKYSPVCQHLPLPAATGACSIGTTARARTSHPQRIGWRSRMRAVAAAAVIGSACLTAMIPCPARGASQERPAVRFLPPVRTGDLGDDADYAVGDLNGDGRQDLVIADGDLSTQFGRGDGSFGPRTV